MFRAGLNDPLPVPSKMLIPSLPAGEKRPPWFAVATSSLPSRLKSAVTSACGLLHPPPFGPTIKLGAATKLGSERSSSFSRRIGRRAVRRLGYLSASEMAPHEPNARSHCGQTRYRNAAEREEVVKK